MKITLDKITYRGMYFEKVELDIPEIIEYAPNDDYILTSKIKEHLDKLIFEETSIRG